MKIKNYLFLIALLLLLNGCGADRVAGSSSGTMTSQPPVELVQAEYTSSLVGDYSLFDNTPVTQLISSYPIVAAFPQMVKVDEPKQLEGYVASSVMLGFNQVQFDMIYQATFNVIQALRLTFAKDMLLSGLDNTPIEQTLSQSLAFKQLNITSQRVITADNLSYIYTYIIDQTIPLEHCKSGSDSCNISISVDIDMDFPTRSVAFAEDDVHIDMRVDQLHIHVKKFQVSNASAKMDLAVNQKDTFVLSFGTQLVQNEKNAVTEHLTWTNDIFLKSNIKGVYSNQYKNSDGKLQWMSIVGSMVGTVGSADFKACYQGSSDCAVDTGAITGNIEGADVDIQFLTRTESQ